jgi:LytS/YehU family sensor histidine kinase
VVILLSFKVILSAAKKREMEKRQLLLAEKRSLLSQMNPHFIFNSLNSIQHFIIQNDQFQANNYLTNFSGLIRKILDNSKKNLIPLNEEIASLSLYLSMEQLRFENGFEYQLIKDNQIDYFETMIPPMLIQPLVENAIWHGLMPLKTMGSLTISFTSTGDYFTCLIEDNGIGREKSALVKNKKEPHASLGILNIQERIELINKMIKKKIYMVITDLRQADGTAAGTAVKIVLPIDLKV